MNVATAHFAWWGKARDVLDGEPAVHPLLWHLIDVGACAQALLDAEPARCHALSQSLGLSPDGTRAFAGYLVALHDIGKLATGFQRKAPSHAPSAITALPPANPHTDHTVEGAALLGALPPAGVFANARQGRVLMDAVAGHHGRPVRDPAYEEKTFGPPGMAAFAQIVDILHALFRPSAPGALDGAALTQAAWRLAGLTTLADWLGSDRSRFPYTPPGDPATYLRLAAYQARDAVAVAGLNETRGGVMNPGMMLPCGATPSPMQKIAEDIALVDGPGLYVIEDVTGSGKTEASAILTARLIGAGKATGAFFALPTMATANAMYARMRGGYRALFAAGEAPSLALAHGRADLNADFARSTVGEGAEADCAAWFAGETRRALLADVGVGTIDQALLAALPSRFQVLRLHGLAGKVMVLDEVHAYDPYMAAGIERLLAFHAMAGGSAILLSATLPRTMRDRFETAWSGERAVGKPVSSASGMGKPVAPPAPPPPDPLPLMSITSIRETARQAVAAAPTSMRRVAVERLASPAEGEARIVAAAGKGAACLYIRNSVDDARETVAALHGAGVSAILFHARFAMTDRLAIEGEVLRVFGKDGTAAERAGRVLVATQVVEQSLDLDFDVMVSDLAPLDLLIQRAGRLRRHARQGRVVADAPLAVVSPDPDAVTGEWLSTLLPRTSAVYRDDALLWRSARALFAAGAIVTPAGTRALIEAVYGPDSETVPPALENAQITAEGQARAYRSFGAHMFLDPADGYVWSHDPVVDGRAPTRLGEATHTVRLATWRDGTLRPWSGQDGRRGWAMSEVSAGPWMLDGVPEPTGALARAEAQVRATWGRWEAETMLLLPLEPAGSAWQGRALDAQEQEIAIAYSATDGLSRA